MCVGCHCCLPLDRQERSHRLWALVYILMINCTFVLQKVPVVKEEDEPEEEDEEEMGHAETYAEYMPIKCMFFGFVKTMDSSSS